MGNNAFEVRDLNVSFGENVVFRDFSLSIQPDTITCILGASGSGKTTLLKAVAGLLPMVSKDAPYPCSYIFQEPRLLPQMSALDNLAVVLPGMMKENREIARKYLADMELSEAESLYPSELSGGMAQRVAVARGLIYDAPILLMDEPFKGLDLALQERLIKYFIKHWETRRKTCLFVTHSILEAILMADRVLVLRSGEQGAEICFDKTFDMPREKRALGDSTVDAFRSELHDVLISL